MLTLHQVATISLNAHTECGVSQQSETWVTRVSTQSSLPPTAGVSVTTEGPAALASHVMGPLLW